MSRPATRSDIFSSLVAVISGRSFRAGTPVASRCVATRTAERHTATILRRFAANSTRGLCLDLAVLSTR